MRYPFDLPTADREELSAAFASHDPLAQIDERIAAIDRISRWAEAETAKWQRARAAVELFAGDAEEGVDVPVQRAGSAPETTASRLDQLNGAARRPKTRRAALLVLF